MLLHELVDAAGVREGHVPFGDPLAVLLEDPRVLAVLSRLRVVPREEPVLEGIIAADDEGGVGVVQDVLPELLLVVEVLVDYPADEGDFRPGAKRYIEIASCL
jgi:hypothetical protein